MQNGNDSMVATTSLAPSRPTAWSRCPAQSLNQSRPSCQRGDSPNEMPVMRVRGVVIGCLPRSTRGLRGRP